MSLRRDAGQASERPADEALLPERVGYLQQLFEVALGSFLVQGPEGEHSGPVEGRRSDGGRLLGSGGFERAVQPAPAFVRMTAIELEGPQVSGEPQGLGASPMSGKPVESHPQALAEATADWYFRRITSPLRLEAASGPC